jgi:hypothetical protein
MTLERRTPMRTGLTGRAILGLALIAARPASASVPELNPNFPKAAPGTAQPGGAVDLQAQLRYWQDKLKVDQQNEAAAFNQKNQRAYARYARAAQMDQQHIVRLTARINRQASGAGQGGGGGNHQALVQTIKAEIARDRDHLNRLRAKMQADRTADPAKLPQERQLLAQVRTKLKDDVALMKEKGLTSQQISSWTGANNQWWSKILGDESSLFGSKPLP